MFRWWQRLHRKPESAWEAFVDACAARRTLGAADLAVVLVAVRRLSLLGVATASVEHFGNRWWLDDAFFDGRMKALADCLGGLLFGDAAPSWASRCLSAASETPWLGTMAVTGT